LAGWPGRATSDRGPPLKKNGLNAWYLIRADAAGLDECAACDAHESRPLAPAGLSDSPAIQEVALGLREYALSTV
jgi:hypothetical protein